jgi:hypothetical protein
MFGDQDPLKLPVQPLTRLNEFYKWSLTIICLNSLKFEQII